MIPRLAALSIAEINPRIWSALGVFVERACFCMVRRRVPTLRLRSDRFNVWRARLVADLVLAIVDQKILWTRPAPQRSRRLQAFAQCELRFLSLGSERSTHSHLLNAECV